MKAVSPLGGGQRGKLKVTAAGVAVVAALMLMAALVTGGCGGNAGNGNSASQLDDEAAGASSSDGGATPQVADTVSGGEGNVMTGYTWDQCMAEMSIRYGNEETARQVCDTVQNDFGTSPRSELPRALQVVENGLGVTPVNPSVPGGTAGGTTTTGGSTGGTTGGGTGGTGSNGWSGIEIVVPPAP